jgi:hypothetical protein
MVLLQILLMMGDWPSKQLKYRIDVTFDGFYAIVYDKIRYLCSESFMRIERRKYSGRAIFICVCGIFETLSIFSHFDVTLLWRQNVAVLFTK